MKWLVVGWKNLEKVDEEDVVWLVPLVADASSVVVVLLNGGYGGAVF